MKLKTLISIAVIASFSAKGAMAPGGPLPEFRVTAEGDYASCNITDVKSDGLIILATEPDTDAHSPNLTIEANYKGAKVELMLQEMNFDNSYINTGQLDGKVNWFASVDGVRKGELTTASPIEIDIENGQVTIDLIVYANFLKKHIQFTETGDERTVEATAMLYVICTGEENSEPI